MSSTGKHWKRLCGLPTYSFFKDMNENICRVPNPTGNWIEIHKAQEIVDNAETDINELKSIVNLFLTYFGMDEDEWNKSVFDKAREVLLEINEKE